MSNYSGELKSVKKTVRMTETMERGIEAFEGADFSEKFRNMFEYCFDKVPTLNQEVYELIKEVDKLQKDSQELLREIMLLREAKGKVSEVMQTLDNLQKDFVGEMIDREHKNIAVMVEQADFIATPNIKEQIRKLNEITGKRHDLSDICKAYKENTYGKGFRTANLEADQLVKELYQEFQSQELDRQPIEFEELQQ